MGASFFYDCLAWLSQSLFLILLTLSQILQNSSFSALSLVPTKSMLTFFFSASKAEEMENERRRIKKKRKKVKVTSAVRPLCDCLVSKRTRPS
ncbi:MAG: hypothetical protein JOS17DRAFT_745409 [Linnemannia elongata]|nr:MAG: hypothetical protein JOS17DRAFT_745409 [Linnemannia elongata]